jgi:hypothetical protein
LIVVALFGGQLPPEVARFTQDPISVSSQPINESSHWLGNSRQESPTKISQWRFQCGNYFESDFAVQANKMLLRKDGGFW